MLHAAPINNVHTIPSCNYVKQINRPSNEVNNANDKQAILQSYEEGVLKAVRADTTLYTLYICTYIIASVINVKCNDLYPSSKLFLFLLIFPIMYLQGYTR